MLRTSLEGAPHQPHIGDPETRWPGVDEPFATEDHAVGIRFYRPKDAFFLPYQHLRGIEFTFESITLRFGREDVIIQGRSLHALFVAIAKQTASRVVQQGESGAATCIVSIERVLRSEGSSGE
jgi:hypothetical protein